jgi:hypothetical protein
MYFWNIDGAQKTVIIYQLFTIQNLNTTIDHAETNVDFSPEITENINHWYILKEQIKWERRFITDINYLTDDLGWDGFFSDKISLNKKTKFYRARLHYIEKKSSYLTHEMFCPPIHEATAGRANPAGIPFLYLCDNRDTVLYEIRAAYLDEVSIGTFSLKESIKHDIAIADFTELPTIFHPSKVAEKIKTKLLKELISKDLSKPIRRYDSELDYIPTQFICEFIKVYTGASGIKFRSSLHKDGNNIVIFDQDLMECTSVERVKIQNVKISSFQTA